MTTGRKSQVEKFDAKWNRKKADDHIIREAEAKRQQAEENKDILDKGIDVMKNIKPNASFEDVFMVVARDSVGSFLKGWNNSMENVIKETLRTEIKSLIREVVQEELTSAARGIQKGLQQALDMKSMIQEVVQEEVKQEVIFKPLSQQVKEQEELEKANKPKRKGHRGAHKYTAEVIEKTILEAADELGDEVYKATKFCKLSSEHLYMYQTIVRNADNVKRGFWKEYVGELLASK